MGTYVSIIIHIYSCKYVYKAIFVSIYVCKYCVQASVALVTARGSKDAVNACTTVRVYRTYQGVGTVALVRYTMYSHICATVRHPRSSFSSSSSSLDAIRMHERFLTRPFVHLFLSFSFQLFTALSLCLFGELSSSSGSVAHSLSTSLGIWNFLDPFSRLAVSRAWRIHFLVSPNHPRLCEWRGKNSIIRLDYLA